MPLMCQVEQAAKNLETKISYSLDFKWPISVIYSQCESVCNLFSPSYLNGLHLLLYSLEKVGGKSHGL